MCLANHTVLSGLYAVLLPQMMLSAMVKTLGSSTQSMRMRSACARCISNTVHSLVYSEQQQQQQQDGGRSPAPHHQGTPGAAAHTPSAAPAGAFHNGRSPSPLRSDLAVAASASPSPSASPRSAPMAASFEELCAEPKLLDNLLLCLNTERCVEAAKNARVEAAVPPLGPGAAEEAEELSRNAVRAVSVMLLVRPMHSTAPVLLMSVGCVCARNEHLTMVAMYTC